MCLLLQVRTHIQCVAQSCRGFPTPADPKNVTEMIAAQDLQSQLQHPQ